MKDVLMVLAKDTTTINKDGTVTTVGNKDTNFGQSVTDIINWIIGILGIVAVIVIIVGGIRYMTSTGDPGKVKGAKDTIMYGIIGLVICVLAFAIVNFVIAGLTK